MILATFRDGRMVGFPGKSLGGCTPDPAADWADPPANHRSRNVPVSLGAICRLSVAES